MKLFSSTFRARTPGLPGDVVFNYTSPACTVYPPSSFPGIVLYVFSSTFSLSLWYLIFLFLVFHNCLYSFFLLTAIFQWRVRLSTVASWPLARISPLLCMCKNISSLPERWPWAWASVQVRLFQAWREGWNKQPMSLFAAVIIEYCVHLSPHVVLFVKCSPHSVQMEITLQDVCTFFCMMSSKNQN